MDNKSITLEYRRALDYHWKKGVFFGITRKHISDLQFAFEKRSLSSTLDLLSGKINTLEWVIDPKNVPSATDLSLLALSSTIHRVAFLIETKPIFFHKSGFFSSDLFRRFISDLRESNLEEYSSLIIRLERRVVYSRQIIEDFLNLRESVYPILTRLEVQHYSWEEGEAELSLKRNKINVVLTFGPDLPGFSFGMPTIDLKSRYVRLAGENKETWFNADVHKRQEWLYDSLTVDSIVADLHSLLDEGFSEVIILMDTFPAEAAMENLAQLIQRSYKLG